MMEPLSGPHDADQAGNVAPSPADLERLLRQLLDRTGSTGSTRSSTSRAGDRHQASGAAHDDATGSQEVVLDIRVDGRSYVLLRGAGSDGRGAVGLSPREKEIVRLVARGLPSKTIAAVLDVSSWTVATHVRRIFAKLGVSSRAEMVARVMEAGLLADKDIHSS